VLERVREDPVALVAPAAQARRRRGREVQLRGAPVAGVRPAVEQPGGDQPADERADGVGREVQRRGRVADPDAGLRLDEPVSGSPPTFARALRRNRRRTPPQAVVSSAASASSRVGVVVGMSRQDSSVAEVSRRLGASGVGGGRALDEKCPLSGQNPSGSAPRTRAAGRCARPLRKRCAAG
jgi:hypothetical protein